MAKHPAPELSWRISPRTVRLLTVPLTAALTLTFSAAALAADRPSATTGWRVVKTIGVANTSLNDVVALRDGTAWAGGQLTGQVPVLYHWTGGHWTRVNIPAAPSSFISNVSATSPSNVWASLANAPDVARLTGSGWVLKSFVHGTDQILMDGVVATGAHGAWVFTLDFATGQPYAEHFNGTSWTETKLPASVSGAGSTKLASASSATNIWTWAWNGTSETTMRYDGTKWQKVGLPANVVPAGKTLLAKQILAESATSVWATVDAWSAKAGYGPVVLLHWGGHGWSKVTGTKPAGALSGPIASDGHGGLWLGAETSAASPFLLHYRAGVWTKYKSPADPDGTVILNSLTLIPGTQSVWGVGIVAMHPDSSDGSVIVKYGR